MHGDARSSQMAEINHAWQVLADSGARRSYDLSLREPSAGEAPAAESAGPAGPVFVEPRYNPLARYQDPPRFPWRFMGGMLLLGIVVLIIGMVTAGNPVPPRIDNVLHPGECVVIEANGDAAEQLCSTHHDGTVVTFLTSDEPCPDGSEPHRDRQGLGTVCVHVA